MNMKYDEFLKLVDQTKNNLNWRYGQALMNVLSTVWLDKHQKIAESCNDPYCDERYVPEVLKNLKDNWSPPNEQK